MISFERAAVKYLHPQTRKHSIDACRCSSCTDAHSILNFSPGAQAIAADCLCVQAAILLHHLRSVAGPKADLQPHRMKFISAFVLCVGAFVGMFALLAWHLYLLSAGQVHSPVTTMHLAQSCAFVKAALNASQLHWALYCRHDIV